MKNARAHARGSCAGILICSLLVFGKVFGQGGAPSARRFPDKIQITVDEVSVIFHASNAFGESVNDLKLPELDLFDNGKGPGALLSLQKLRERPLRMGLILDTSGSMSTQLATNRRIAIKAAQRLMQKQGDFGMAIGFRRSRNIVQPWTSSLDALAGGIGRVASTTGGPLDGTGLFDALYSTCSYEFGSLLGDDERVILLFSDGVDTASQSSLEEAVGKCQRTHTAIYAFTSATADSGEMPTGFETLQKLSMETGGGMILIDETDAAMRLTLDELDSDIRDEYELFYRPNNLKHDGSFHRLVLVGPARAPNIVSQSGYYAPAR